MLLHSSHIVGKMDNVSQKLEEISKSFDAIKRLFGEHDNTIGKLRANNYNGFEALTTQLNKFTVLIDERLKHLEANWQPMRGRTNRHTDDVSDKGRP